MVTRFQVKGKEHQDKLILVDAMGDFYRNYHKMSQQLNKEVAGFFGMIRSCMAYRRWSDDIIIIWEGSSTLRKTIDPNYKIGRGKMEGNFYEQVNDSRTFLSHFFKQLKVVDYESDDLLATLAYERHLRNEKTMIITGDGDLQQMLTENISIYHPIKMTTYTPGNLRDERFTKPQHILGIKAIEGDGVDGIAGVPRIRHKDQLVKAYFPEVNYVIPTSEQAKEAADKFVEALNADSQNIMSANEKTKVIASSNLIKTNVELARLRIVPSDKYYEILPSGDARELMNKYKCASFEQYVQELDRKNA